MGVVFLARDRGHRTVALKVLRSSVAGDPTARRRLAREVETMQRVRSPNVAEVIDADLDGDMPYIVTRFVPGRTLDDVVTQDGPLRGRRARQPGLRAGRRAGRGARRRGGAPRRQAGQRDAVPGHSRGDRLRHRPGPRRDPADHDRDVHGNPGLPGARGDRRQAEHRGLRRACLGSHGGVRGHRPPAVRHRPLRGHLLPDRERAGRPGRGSRGTAPAAGRRLARDPAHRPPAVQLRAQAAVLDPGTLVQYPDSKRGAGGTACRRPGPARRDRSAPPAPVRGRAGGLRAARARGERAGGLRAADRRRPRRRRADRLPARRVHGARAGPGWPQRPGAPRGLAAHPPDGPGPAAPRRSRRRPHPGQLRAAGGRTAGRPPR